jgi:hypothetical protein
MLELKQIQIDVDQHKKARTSTIGENGGFQVCRTDSIGTAA